jgi:hypothetical protein
MRVRLGILIIFTGLGACKARTEPDNMLRSADSASGSVAGLTYSDSAGNSVSFADGSNLVFQSGSSSESFYTSYRYESGANRIVIPLRDGDFELFFADDLKSLVLPASGERAEATFSLTSAASRARQDQLQIVDAASDNSATEGLALAGAKWCIWVVRQGGLFGPDSRPGCKQDIERALRGVRCDLAAVSTSPRLICSAVYYARDFKRVGCVESVHDHIRSSGCFISAQTNDTGSSGNQSDSLDDINRRLEALLKKLDANNGSSGNNNSGGSGNQGSNRGVTMADVNRAIADARAKYNVDAGTRSACMAAGAQAGWSATMQAYYCEFPPQNPNIRECFTYSVRGTSPYSKRTYPEAYSYCHTQGLRGERPMKWIYDNQDAVFRAVMIDKKF